MFIEDAICNCLTCDSVFNQPLRKQGGGSRKLYCSPDCCKKAWVSKNPIKRKQAVVKYDHRPVSKIKKRERTRQARLKKYGITDKIFYALLQKQDQKCQGCCKKLDRYSARIDHNHTTGKVRGLLCGHCNWALGHAKDSVEILSNLIKHIETNET